MCVFERVGLTYCLQTVCCPHCVSIVVATDGTNTYIGTVDYESVEADGDAIDAAVVTELVQLTGVADATTLANGNFLDFIA